MAEASRHGSSDAERVERRIVILVDALAREAEVAPSAAWRADVDRQLGELEGLLAVHFEREEQVDADEHFVEMFPHLAERLRELTAEHGSLLATVRALRATVRSLEPGAGPAWGRAGSELARFVGALRHHERGEDELLQGAFDDDLAPGD